MQEDSHNLPRITGINWPTALFLVVTLLIAALGTPLYVWRFGLGGLEIGLFFVMLIVTGMSITVGYHRLYAHGAFSASWPVRLTVALFGAAAFEGSILQWASDHRYHHQFTDREGNPGDPHSIERGLLWAHVGWLLLRKVPSLERTNVDDLRRESIVVWQDRNFVTVAVAIGFLLPMACGAATTAWLGESALVGLLAGFLFGGCTRVVAVQHFTFLINSLAHAIGTRPYDGSSSARDSTLLAVLTFGEGYHNYHHRFPADYRNGPRLWHFDPGKWAIWILSRVGLANGLRRIPRETIHLTQVKEQRRQLERRLAETRKRIDTSLRARIEELEQQLVSAHQRFRQLLGERSRLARDPNDRERLAALRRECRAARREFWACLRTWRRLFQQAMTAV